MGFFSWNCCACNKEILNVYSATAIDKQWLCNVVALIDAKLVDETIIWNLDLVDKDCIQLKGIYDGYGSIEHVDEGISFIDLPGTGFRLFHEACWESCGSPDAVADLHRYPVNNNAPNQGHFVEDSDFAGFDKPQYMLY